MSDLTEFLLARITEDEAVAREALHSDAVSPGSWVAEHHNSEYHSEPNRAHIAEDKAGHYWSVAHEVFIPIAEHMARQDPARVLLDCDAKRRIVGLSEWSGPKRRLRDRIFGPAADEAFRHGINASVRSLALTYAEHPDFDRAWTA